VAKATPSPTSDQPAWEPPAWLLPESVKVADHWWEVCQECRTWPGTFVEAFAEGYQAGYERGQRRRKVDHSEDI